MIRAFVRALDGSQLLQLRDEIETELRRRGKLGLHADVVEEVAENRAIPADRILGLARDRATVEARAEIAHKLRDKGLSWSAIGSVLNRERTSVGLLLRRKKDAIG